MQVAMEDGYVLLHVLEVVVPGRDLGENPTCEIVLGDAAAHCPVPSTLQSENVSLPTGGASEPVVHVRAFDAEQRPVGMVVVPVSSLIPTEVWNVWYAMDDGGVEPEEKPPEETPKMHLLLQCIPKEAATEETQQVREMRGQDFLLRALQQLNAALEAKVYESQAGGSIGSTSPAGYPAVTPGRVPGPAETPQPAVASGTVSTSLTPVNQQAERLRPRQTPQLRQQQRKIAGTPGSVGRSAAVTPLEKPNGQQLAEEAADTNGRPLPEQQAEAKLRLEPYERTIMALEEKQRLYGDQESRVQGLNKALEEHQQRSNALLSQLQDVFQRSKTEVDQERDSARQVNSAKGALQQRCTELELEVALRKAHEESLQQRVSLMESELAVVHQKCVAAQATEDEANHIIAEVDGLKNQRQRLHDQLQEQGRELSLLQEENWQLKEDRGREIEKAHSVLEKETLAKETLHLELQQTQDLVRDKEAEVRLANEKAESSERKVLTLENEVASMQALLERERQHRQDVEKKLDGLELMQLHSHLDEHKILVRGLRLELDRAKKELNDERGRVNSMEIEVATAKKDLVKGQRQLEEFRHQIISQDELKEEIRSLKQRNEDLREQYKMLQQESRKVTDRFEREISEHLKSQKTSHEDRESKLEAQGELKQEAAIANRKAEEYRLQQEQAARALESAQRANASSEDAARQLYQVQQELTDSLRDRNELHQHVERITAKFREDVYAQDQRQGELEVVLEDRNNEIKLLMYRLQELSARYVPVKGDGIDLVLSKWVNGYRPAVPFFRLGQGLYLFGRRQVTVKISNDKPVFRVGGGFIGFDKFIEQFASEELERLLTYDLDERSGEPKFAEALKAKNSMEESGMIEELRQKAAEEQMRSRSIIGLQNSLGSRRSLNSSRGTL